MSIRLGLTLPSFQDDPAVPLRVAEAAESAGVDAVFAFDHLFRIASDGSRRPALECTTLLAAAAARTSRISIGSLVARATLRPPAVLSTAFATLERVAGDRVIVAVGAGDEESRPEMEAFGLPFGTRDDRVAALAECVQTLRGDGHRVWVGGSARHVGVVAARADGWNSWGGDVRHFRDDLASIGSLASSPNFVPSWGGLVVLAEDDDAARAKASRLGAGPSVLVGGPETIATRVRAYAEVGARWVVLGPLDSADPANATLIGERVRPLLET